MICDNYSPHTEAELAAWRAAHDVGLVFTPSNASRLNWIECEFTALRYLTLDSSDYPPTPTRKPPSPTTSTGTTAAPNPDATSPRTPRSADPMTYPTLRDAALGHVS